MQIYKIPPQHIQGSIPVVTIIHPTTKVWNGFDVEENYLRKYMVNFRGCYFFGPKYHYITKEFSIAIYIDFDKKAFFKQIWVHKPHTKKSRKTGYIATMEEKIKTTTINHNI